MRTEALLLEMQRENRADHAALVEKVDTGFTSVREALTTHAREDDKRFNELNLLLQPVLETHKAMKWAKRTVIGGAAVAVIDLLVHLAKGVL